MRRAVHTAVIRTKRILPRETGEDAWSRIFESPVSSAQSRAAANQGRSKRGPPHG